MLAASCTSEHGVLPEPTTSPSTTAPGAGVAARALLQAEDLPPGFETKDIDAAARWGDVLDEVSQLTPVRPDYEEPLSSIVATLTAVPPDAAGAGFGDDNGREILNFTGVTDAEVGRGLVAEIGALNARCDGYVLQVPDRGSRVLTVTPIALAGVPTGDDVALTAWEVTILSDVLRRTEARAVVAAGDIVSLIGVTGEPALSPAEQADLVEAAVVRAEEAGR